MEAALSEGQRAIRESVLKLCAPFDDGYWMEKDRPAVFPTTSSRPWPPAAGSA